MLLEECKFNCNSCGREVNPCLCKDSDHKDYRSLKTKEGIQIFLCMDCFNIKESLNEQWEDYNK